MKTERKETEKKVGIKYLDKRKYCVGTEPSAFAVNLVMVAQWLVHCRGSIPSCGTSFFSQSIFLSSLSNLCQSN